MTAKLTHAERGRLGGLTTAMRHDAHAAAVARGKKGGEANLERNGRLALIKANHMRNGKLPRGPIVARKETAAVTAASHSPEGIE